MLLSCSLWVGIWARGPTFRKPLLSPAQVHKVHVHILRGVAVALQHLVHPVGELDAFHSVWPLVPVEEVV